MDEATWLASDDPAAMLAYLTQPTRETAPGGPVSDRKLRLFACACCRQVWDGEQCQACEGKGGAEIPGWTHSGWRACGICHGTGKIGGLTDERSRRAVEVAIDYLDHSGWLIDVVRQTAKAGMTSATQAALLRDIVGNPFRWRPRRHKWFGAEEGEWGPLQDWLTPTVLTIARRAYTEHDFVALPILADALEDAGCDNEDILRHCRGEEQHLVWVQERMDHDYQEVPRRSWRPLRGPHVRGCWVLDLILGKE